LERARRRRGACYVEMAARRLRCVVGSHAQEKCMAERKEK
jgi:hypothetical protein